MKYRVGILENLSSHGWCFERNVPDGSGLGGLGDLETKEKEMMYACKMKEVHRVVSLSFPRSKDTVHRIDAKIWTVFFRIDSIWNEEAMIGYSRYNLIRGDAGITTKPTHTWEKSTEWYHIREKAGSRYTRTDMEWDDQIGKRQDRLANDSDHIYH